MQPLHAGRNHEISLARLPAKANDAAPLVTGCLRNAAITLILRDNAEINDSDGGRRKVQPVRTMATVQRFCMMATLNPTKPYFPARVFSQQETTANGV